MFSQFLPQTFDPNKTIVLLAGKGTYPVLLKTKIETLGLRLCLVAIEDETDPSFASTFPQDQCTWIKLGQLKKLISILKKWEAGYALLAGQITPKRLFKLSLDFKALLLLAKLKERNAETLFGIVVKTLEQEGVAVLDARSFMDEDLVPRGVICGKISHQCWIDHGIHIAREVARLDIGQSVVVTKGTVLAVEGFDGTNALIDRAGTLGASDVIFVKTTKPTQDFRIDIPVFGIQTTEHLIRNKIKTIALEAQKTIFLDKDKVLSLAKEEKLTIYGF